MATLGCDVSLLRIHVSLLQSYVSLLKMQCVVTDYAKFGAKIEVEAVVAIARDAVDG